MSILLSDKDNAPGVVNTALRAWPINEPFFEDGVTFAEVNGGNPLAAVAFSNRNTKTFRGLGNLFAAINFLSGFTFKTSIQFDLKESKLKNFAPKYFVGPLQQNEENDLKLENITETSLIFENTLA